MSALAYPTLAPRASATRSAGLTLNPDIMRRRRFLNSLLTGMIGLSALFIPVGVLDNSIPEALAISAALAGMVLARYISGRGYPTPAAYLFAAICCAIVTAIMVTRASAFAALTYAPYLYTVPVLTVGIAAHRRAAFAVATLTTAIMIATDLLLPHLARFELQADGHLHALGSQPESTTLATIGILLFLCAFIAYTLERVIVTALRDTDHLATDLAQAEAQITQRARDTQLAATVRAQSTALAATVQQQSTTAAEQLAALQEINATVEQLAVTARQIANAGQDVQHGVAAVLQRVDRGRESDTATSRSVEHLNTQVSAMAAQVQVVEGHVSQINKIATVLSTVADHIHLLALNATIEAAGAGSHGRRFAVVAQEVQTLAHQARQASAQVRGQVADIQTVTAQALAITRQGQQAAGEAVAQAQQTRIVHGQIGSIVGAAHAQAEQIAQGTAQQQQAARQVMLTLHTFIESMREMAEGGHRVASAAQHLSSLAGALDADPT
ncbi:MAG TPA: methyl-accepting chemotaxis protein [Chloroflexia bacterium]|nr:methyl-accepting chemotaxis protein [Chloroflexia bacterium]